MPPQLFLTPESYWERVTECVSGGPSMMFIASYGMGFGYRVNEFLCELGSCKIPINILIGVPFNGGQEFRRNCEEAIKEYKRYKSIKWGFRSDSHLKCVIFCYLGGSTIALTGGRNLSFSSAWDASVELNSAFSKRMLTFFNDIWKGAVTLRALI